MALCKYAQNGEAAFNVWKSCQHASVKETDSREESVFHRMYDFFDSDDIMLKNMITDTLSILKTQKMYKPKYFDFRIL